LYRHLKCKKGLFQNIFGAPFFEKGALQAFFGAPFFEKGAKASLKSKE